MDNTILIIVAVVILATLLFLLSKIQSLSKSNSSDKSEQQLELLKEQLKLVSENQANKIDSTRQELDKLLRQQNEMLNRQLTDSQKSLQEQFSISQRSVHAVNKETSEIIKNVTEKLTVLEKTNDQVVGFAKQMQSLENILKNPKQRGVLGEYFLETTLKNVLPPGSYQMQYKFKNGEIVDAVVFHKDQIIPIDSKFSLENYNRIATETNPEVKLELEKVFKQDLKKRIDETSKYIRPEEGTLDFAFMFIPSEGIYYDLLINRIGSISVNTEDLIQYAYANKKVIIISPTTFMAYLQLVLQGLRTMHIEESAKEIIQNVSKLSKHLQAYDEYFSKLGKSLGTTVNTYNSAYKELGKIDKDVMKISGDVVEIASEEVDKPISLL